MKMLAGIFAALALGIVLPQALDGQDLQEGAWSGTIVQNPNRGPQDVTFEVQRVPDPLARWRTSGDVLTMTITPPGGGPAQPLSQIGLEGDTLSFFISAINSSCNLTRQENGGFEGRCGNAPRRGMITMAPPSVPEE